MKLGRPVLAAVTVGVVLAAVFAIFATELASNQTRSRNEIKTEVRDRAQLTASLMSSLVEAVEQSGAAQNTLYYGGSVIDTHQLNQVGQSRYEVVTDSNGTVLAASSGFDRATGLPISRSVLAHVAKAKDLYYLGDLYPYPGGGYVADLVVPFQTQDKKGERLLVTGLNPSSLVVQALFGQSIRTVPGVNGEVNYYVDGHGRVIAASLANVRPGDVPVHITTSALSARPSGEQHGYYFQEAQLQNSSWKVLLVAPSGALFATVDGAREYVPWIIFAALVLVAAVAALLAWRVMRSAEVVSEVNAKLAAVNQELSVANESLHQRAAELARSNEELESFASIASHDLQEPLRKVRTFTEQLTALEGERLSDKGRDYLGRANSAAERMQRLIEDLLKFSRVSTQGRPFEQVDLAEVTRRVLVDLENQVEEAGAAVDVGPLPVITADPLQMQQLMQNLVSNAIKFRKPEVVPEVRIRSEVKGGKMHLTVSDNGIGFEPKYSARIFRIFERLHGRTEYPGTGIGLALCRKVTDRHGGVIEAQSMPGEGATFEVILPVEQPAGTPDAGPASDRREEVRTGATA